MGPEGFSQVPLVQCQAKSGELRDSARNAADCLALGSQRFNVTCVFRFGASYKLSALLLSARFYKEMEVNLALHLQHSVLTKR